MNKFGGTMIALYTVMVIIYGSIITKLIQHEILQNHLVVALTIALVTALAIISYIAGWASHK